MIVEVALHDRPQPLPRLRNRIVPALPQLLPDFLQFRAHPLAYRLPPHGEVPGCPGPPTPMGESQKIERLRLPSPSPLPVAVCEPPELNHSGLLRVEFQSDLPQLLLQFPAQAFRFIPVSNPRTASSAYRTMITSPRARLRQATTQRSSA